MRKFTAILTNRTWWMKLIGVPAVFEFVLGEEESLEDFPGDLTDQQMERVWEQFEPPDYS